MNDKAIDYDVQATLSVRFRNFWTKSGRFNRQEWALRVFRSEVK